MGVLQISLGGAKKTINQSKSTECLLSLAGSLLPALQPAVKASRAQQMFWWAEISNSLANPIC